MIKKKKLPSELPLKNYDSWIHPNLESSDSLFSIELLRIQICSGIAGRESSWIVQEYFEENTLKRILCRPDCRDATSIQKKKSVQLCRINQYILYLLGWIPLSWQRGGSPGAMSVVHSVCRWWVHYWILIILYIIYYYYLLVLPRKVMLLIFNGNVSILILQSTVQNIPRVNKYS